MTDTWRTLKAVAALLAVNRHQVSDLIRSGELEAVDVSLRRGGKRASWRISSEALEAFCLRRGSAPVKRAPRRKTVKQRWKSFV
jgi:hypothetical protein